MTDTPRPQRHNLKGILAASIILSSWAGCLVILLTAVSPALNWWVVAAVLVQTFLYTGLFITAHDAMHRTLAPDFPRLNRFLGALAVGCYALFSFRKLRQSHWEHHRHPASADDPDYHDGTHSDVLSWYWRFMRNYVSVPQLVGMAVAFNVLHMLAGIPVANLIVFWVVPSLLSTVQLFYFGTVLPHRRPAEGYDDEHRATTNDFSAPISFLTCYHFGYHWEHHQRPDLPWWSLPRYRKQRMKAKSGGTSQNDNHIDHH